MKQLAKCDFLTHQNRGESKNNHDYAFSFHLQLIETLVIEYITKCKIVLRINSSYCAGVDEDKIRKDVANSKLQAEEQ